MSKNIVFCADGTWNGPGDPTSDDHSNVFKLFLNLSGQDSPGTLRFADEQERVEVDAQGQPVQVSKYIHGVGDSKNYLVKFTEGVLGAGLISRIVRGYTFISRNYRDGDRIYIVGFSRGAYTARALAGLICGKGLLDATKLKLDDNDANRTQAYQWGSAVWNAYMSEALTRRDRSLLDIFVNTAKILPAFFQQRPPTEMIQAGVEAVGVWDTVGALGIPEYNRKGERLDAFQFADSTLSRSVNHGLHAIAVDEQRADFTPTLWDPGPRITQVLFPGAHSDVGGGYQTKENESDLSDRALMWMSDELNNLGVRFITPLKPPTVRPLPLSGGPAHEPWALVLKTGVGKHTRTFPGPPVLGVARSVLDRKKAGAVKPDPSQVAIPYDPRNLAAYISGIGVRPGVKVHDNC